MFCHLPGGAFYSGIAQTCAKASELGIHCLKSMQADELVHGARGSIEVCRVFYIFNLVPERGANFCCLLNGIEARITDCGGKRVLHLHTYP